jgi:hypothetical protein
MSSSVRPLMTVDMVTLLDRFGIDTVPRRACVKVRWTRG